jgi:GTPase SAR1 family protein
VEKRQNEIDYVFVDTPGQIEIFTWSASGAIITEAFASTFPTVITYMVDTPRSTNPVTFMSNMLYACSILYKMRLPLLLAFNKVDVAQHQFAIEVGSTLYMKIKARNCGIYKSSWGLESFRDVVSLLFSFNEVMICSFMEFSQGVDCLFDKFTVSSRALEPFRSFSLCRVFF